MIAAETIGISPGERIAEIRQGIDDIDRQIAQLWAMRIQLAAEIGLAKQEAGLPVYHHAREQEVRTGFADHCEDLGIPRGNALSVIGAIVKSSHRVQ